MGCGAAKPTDPWLEVDEKLPLDDYIQSPNNKFQLKLKSDGNLVIVHALFDVWWESKTAGKGVTHAMLKKDGDFALFKDSEEVWSLGSGGCGGDELWIEDNGFVGIYKKDVDVAKCSLYEEWLKIGEDLEKGDWLWSNNGKYKLELQDGGNLVLVEDDGGKVIWQTNTGGSGADSLDMEKDGDLVLYKGETEVWSTKTENSGATELWVEDDGTIVLWDANDREVWSSR